MNLIVSHAFNKGNQWVDSLANFALSILFVIYQNELQISYQNFFLEIDQDFCA